MKRSVYIMILFVLAACGGGPEVIVPTNTPDPLAFFAPTPISPGRSQNPLRVVFVPRTDVTTLTAAGDEDTSAEPTPEEGTPPAGPVTISREEAINALDRELEANSGLSIEIVIVGTDAEAVDLLCNYNDEDRYAAPWLTGPSAVLAIRQGCGEPALVGARDGRTRLAAQMISSSGVGLRGLEGRTYCRLDRSDFYSWILPSLALDAEGLSPTGIGRVDDRPDYDLLLGSITEGACAATTVPAGFLQLDAFAEYRNRIGVTATLTAMPYGVLLYPPELLLDDRVALTEAFLEISAANAEDEEAATAINTEDVDVVEVDRAALTTPQLALLELMGAEGVRITTEENLADLLAFMDDVEIVARRQP